MCIWFDVYLCNFDVDVFGSMYKCGISMNGICTRFDVHACGMMYICVISSCVNAVRYIYF